MYVVKIGASNIQIEIMSISSNNIFLVVDDENDDN
jgi:hypothetical protein